MSEERDEVGNDKGAGGPDDQEHGQEAQTLLEPKHVRTSAGRSRTEWRKESSCDTLVPGVSCGVTWGSERGGGGGEGAGTSSSERRITMGRPPPPTTSTPKHRHI